MTKPWYAETDARDTEARLRELSPEAADWLSAQLPCGIMARTHKLYEFPYLLVGDGEWDELINLRRVRYEQVLGECAAYEPRDPQQASFILTRHEHPDLASVTQVIFGTLSEQLTPRSRELLEALGPMGQEWLRRAHPSLGDSPARMLSRPGGPEQVEQALEALIQGSFA